MDSQGVGVDRCPGFLNGRCHGQTNAACLAAIFLSTASTTLGVSPPQAASPQPTRVEAALLMAEATANQAARLGKDAPAVRLTGNMQLRYVANIGDEKLPAGSKDTALGFQTRRTRLIASGDLSDETLSYKVELDLSRTTGAGTLLDSLAKIKLDGGWSIRVGQFKLPLLKEELISHTRQLAVERSTVTGVFTGDYSQGAAADWQGNHAAVSVMVSDGLRAINGDFTAASEADLALTARFDYKFRGTWKDLDQMTSWRGSTGAAGIGAALHWQTGGSTFAAGPGGRTTDADVLVYTIDAQLTGDGWNAMAALVGRHADPATGPALDDFGFLVQGGAFVADAWEVFARYGLVLADGDRSGDDAWHEITLGANHYFIPRSHAAKFSVDLTICPGAQSDSSGLIVPTTATGILASDKAQQVLRAQLQLMF